MYRLVEVTDEKGNKQESIEKALLKATDGVGEISLKREDGRDKLTFTSPKCKVSIPVKNVSKKGNFILAVDEQNIMILFCECAGIKPDNASVKESKEHLEKKEPDVDESLMKIMDVFTDTLEESGMDAFEELIVEVLKAIRYIIS